MDAPVLVAQRLQVLAPKLRDVVVARQFVGIDGALRPDVLFHHAHELLSIHLGCGVSDDPALAFDDTDDVSLVLDVLAVPMVVDAVVAAPFRIAKKPSNVLVVTLKSPSHRAYSFFPWLTV
jgi:hypothetical protein